jgi:RHS repeat-associated protein
LDRYECDDKDGNILTLTRDYKGDNFSYQYYSGTNRLKNINGTAMQQYIYDYNGNVTADSVRKVTGITYDYRNLPVEMNITSNNEDRYKYKMRYKYDEAGNRIRKQMYRSRLGEENWTLYNDEVYIRDAKENETAMYENSNLQYINILGAGLEGKVRKDDRGNTIYSYYYKDHLGSITAVMDGASGTITQAQDYDALGDICRTYSTAIDTTVNKFTGKERDQETGYDYFGARYYDSRIGRWLQTEPLYNKYLQFSPYCYGLLNPMKLVDADGNEVYIHGSQAEDILNYLQKQMPYLNLNLDNGKLIYSGNGMNEREQKLIEAINSDIKVNLFSSDENYYFDENNKMRSIIIGAYGGSSYDKYGILNANQYINLNHAKTSNEVGGWTESEIVLHEILEAYIGATNYPNKFYDYEIFDKVHNMTNELSPKQKDKLISITGSDNNGKTFKGIQGPKGAYWLYYIKDKKYVNYNRKLSYSEFEQIPKK